MRKYNEKRLVSDIYARLRDLPMSEADRHDAIRALRQAEQLVGAFVWMKSKLAGVGNVFLKPSLKH